MIEAVFSIRYSTENMRRSATTQKSNIAAHRIFTLWSYTKSKTSSGYLSEKGKNRWQRIKERKGVPKVMRLIAPLFGSHFVFSYKQHCTTAFERNRYKLTPTDLLVFLSYHQILTDQMLVVDIVLRCNPYQIQLLYNFLIWFLDYKKYRTYWPSVPPVDQSHVSIYLLIQPKTVDLQIENRCCHSRDYYYLPKILLRRRWLLFHHLLIVVPHLRQNQHQPIKLSPLLLPIARNYEVV